jgi:hypothetical protein
LDALHYGDTHARKGNRGKQCNDFFHASSLPPPMRRRIAIATKVDNPALASVEPGRPQDFAISDSI